MGNLQNQSYRLSNKIQNTFQQKQLIKSTKIYNNFQNLDLDVSTNVSKNQFLLNTTNSKIVNTCDSEENDRKDVLASIQRSEEIYDLQMKQNTSATDHIRQLYSQDNRQKYNDLPQENKYISSLDEIRQQNVWDYYWVTKDIERGQHKHSYIVTSKNNGKIYYLKIIAKIYFKSRQLVEGKNEIKHLISLKHRYINKLIEVFQNINTYSLIFQYIQGQNLKTLISSKICDQIVCKIIIKKILIGLQYIHSLGIVHRDIRLENILVFDYEDNIEIRIINFGLSINIDSIPNEASYGTLFYSSPQSHKIINQKYDIWSVGILMLILLSCDGYEPFLTQTEPYSISKMKYKIRQNSKYISKDGDDFIQQLLRTKNRKRPTAQKALKLEWLENLSQN